MIDQEIRKNFYNKMNVDEVEVGGRLVFLRVDYDLDLEEERKTVDDAGIMVSLPTIKHLLEQGAKLVLASHLGKPKGKANQEYSLVSIAPRLSAMLDREVIFVPECVGPAVLQAKKDLLAGQVLLLENLRFHPGELKNSEAFATDLAAEVDLYVNDAFGLCHHDHASVTGVPGKVPLGVTGFQVARELAVFHNLMTEPVRPFVAVVGGARVSDKIGLIQKMLEKADTILIGGGIAYTFLKALNIDVGISTVDNDMIDLVRDLMGEAKDLGVDIHLPHDNVVATRTEDEVKTSVVRNENIPSSWMALDMGPDTLRYYAAKLKKAKTVFWNGPLGVYEQAPFMVGTKGLARVIADGKFTSVVTGGDTIECIKRCNLLDKFTHLSTGGQASLEFIQGRILPGIISLTDRQSGN